MSRNTILTLILTVGLSGLSACTVSEAQKQKAANNSNLSTETVNITKTPTPEKKS